MAFAAVAPTLRRGEEASEVEFDQALDAELDPAALELLPSEVGLTGCGDPVTCGKTCVLTIWHTIPVGP